MYRLMSFAIASLVFACATAASAVEDRHWDAIEGSGTLDARAPDGTRLGPCPLEHTDVAVEITGFVARIRVTQLFANHFSEPVAAVYTFPLSERAAVDAMWMRTGERVIRGAIARREEARKIYEAARDHGQLAGLLDQERPNVFTQSVANLVPGAAVEIKIEYVEPLVYSGGSFEFVFPTVVGPRFVPGSPTGHAGTGWAPDTTRVPDGSRVTPPVTPEGTRAGHDLRLSVEIDAGVPILDVAAPSYDVVVTRPEAHRARVRLRNRQEIPNRDFVLRYTVAGDTLQSGYLTHRPAGAAEGYVSFVLLPPKRVTAQTAAPKEVVFVIDRSGSQSGRPLEVAKATVLWILDHLNPNDTFQVVDFGSEAHELFSRPELVSAESKRTAHAYLATLDADGGTLMAEAVAKVCAMPADGNRLRIVTFMTDGYVGNDFEVIDLIRRLRGTSRWFPFGTGNSVNRFLIEGMAREGGGEPEYVILNDATDEIARRFYDRIASPVLTDVHIEARGLTLLDTTPQQLRDVWAERPLILHARYRQTGRGEIVLHGFQQGRPYEQRIQVELPEREDENGALASMWARARVEELMAQNLQGLQSGQFPADLKEQVVKLALDHGLLTQFTSFVAVEERVVNQGGTQRTITVPVEMPDGVRYDGIFGTNRPEPAAAGTGTAALSGAITATAKLAAAPQLADDKAAGRQPAENILATDAAAPSSERDARELTQTARERLSPALVALLQTGTAAVHINGTRVEITVHIDATDTTTIPRLRTAGLGITNASNACVTGWIEIGKLASLAQVTGVDRIVATGSEEVAAECRE
jgi:Ca-activated chloride channel family protein